MHGTVAGYKKHIRDKTAPCEGCKEANRLEGIRYRAEHKEVQARIRLYNRATSRAFIRLKKLFPVEWYTILKEEEERAKREDESSRSNESS